MYLGKNSNRVYEGKFLYLASFVVEYTYLGSLPDSKILVVDWLTCSI